MVYELLTKLIIYIYKFYLRFESEDIKSLSSFTSSVIAKPIMPHLNIKKISYDFQNFIKGKSFNFIFRLYLYHIKLPTRGNMITGFRSAHFQHGFSVLLGPLVLIIS